MMNKKSQVFAIMFRLHNIRKQSSRQVSCSEYFCSCLKICL